MKLSELVSKFDAMDNEQSNYNNCLTPDQQKIHNKVFMEYDNNNIKYAVLDAKSGSGKSTTIRAIVATAESKNISVAVTATTGKASSALGGRTIHSFLGLKMVQNDDAEDKDEALVLKSSDLGCGDKPKILIIDESSMIGQNIFRAIKKENFNYVLFVLDSNQLPPVKEKAVIWEEIAHSRHYLTKTLRASDKDMVKLFDDFKDYKDGIKDDLILSDYVNNRNIVSIDFKDCDYIPKNSDSCCTLYRNKLVEYMADRITQKGHNKFNLNSGVNVTKMVVKKDSLVDRNGYYKRDFVNETVFYNGEDVTIEILENETTALIRNGYCFYKDFKISFNRTGTGLMISKKLDFDEKDSLDDKYYINLPIEDVLANCTLCSIEDEYIILMWDNSESEYRDMVDKMFMKLLPMLRIHREVKKMVRGKDFNIDYIPYDIVEMYRASEDEDDFYYKYNDSIYGVDRKQAWSEFMSAKSVITARVTTARTINKAQGISVPCVVITNNSFYGASVSAQYVAVTRGKHGIILIDNVPNILQEDK